MDWTQHAERIFRLRDNDPEFDAILNWCHIRALGLTVNRVNHSLVLQTTSEVDTGEVNDVSWYELGPSIPKYSVHDRVLGIQAR